MSYCHINEAYFIVKLKVEPRILEFQPVGINDSNMARYIAFDPLVEAERYVSALVPFFARRNSLFDVHESPAHKPGYGE